MTSAESTPSWETLTPWSKRFPFAPGDKVRPVVVERRSAYLSSWGPDPDGRHRTPCWVYTSTEQIGFVCIMSVAPGDFFEIGNHPNVETYYQLSGVLQVSNPDTGQVAEVRPGDGFVMPAYEYHVGYNFSTEESLTLACVPGESHTPEFHDNPLLAENYSREPISLFGSVREHDGFESRLRQLASWPDEGRPVGKRDFRVLPKRDWLRFVLGKDPRAAVLASFYYSTPQLAAWSVLVPPNRISEVHQADGETVIYLYQHNLIIDLAGTGDSLYAEAGDAIFIPPGVPFQYQNRSDVPVEAMVFTSPFGPASLFSA
jgi:mannose-6-phosphate isomerase-like protein (cupin superfamily)